MNYFFKDLHSFLKESKDNLKVILSFNFGLQPEINIFIESENKTIKENFISNSLYECGKLFYEMALKISEFLMTKETEREKYKKNTRKYHVSSYRRNRSYKKNKELFKKRKNFACWRVIQ